MKDIKIIDGNFERCTPESQGISSKAISECLQKIKDTGLFVHSMHIFKNGYLVGGGCANPITLNGRRRVYSVMKSVTALAIDFHLQEGTFKLDDPIIKYYPNVKVNNEEIKKLTIKDTLSMMVGHERDAQREYDQARYGIGTIPKTYRDGEQPELEEAAGKTLQQLFFDLPFEHKPGSEFFYDNTVPEIVGMLAENVSGENYYDYLQPRLFEPLGIDYCRCNRIEEYDGTTRNFSATTVMTLRDMLKFGLFYMQHGSWEGKQLLKREIIDDGITKHCETRDFVIKHADHGFSLDTDAFGYGYQMWMNKYGGYTLMGGACQTCCCLPEKDVMISFTCFDRREASTPELCITDIIYNTVIKDMSTTPLAEDVDAYNSMLADFENWSTAPQLSETSAKASDVAGKEFKANTNDLQIKTVSLDEANKLMRFAFEDGHTVDIKYGTEGKFVLNSKGLGHKTDDYSTIYTVDPEEVSASGGWDKENFVLNLHYSAQMNSFNCIFNFEKDKVEIAY